MDYASQVAMTLPEIVLAPGRGELKLMDRRQDDAARQEPSGRDRAAGDDLDDHVPF